MGFKNHIRHRGFVVEAYYENSRSVMAYWLRHYATNRQVAGSIPDGLIGIFK